ncbi:MAG: hypothetical protein JWQ98_1937 [Chlorobi bacterium]|nr:hypothetical protein [Chlorobiota bacterium]
MILLASAIGARAQAPAIIVATGADPAPIDNAVADRHLFDSLLVRYRARSAGVKPAQFDQMTFPRNWIRIEMSDTAFVLYHPCDGNNETIVLTADRLTFGWRLEAEVALLRAVSVPSDTTATVFLKLTDCADDPGAFNTIDVRILDRATGLAIWHWGFGSCAEGRGRTWLMIPSERIDRFPKVDNPCPDMKLPELAFRPIPY